MLQISSILGFAIELNINNKKNAKKIHLVALLHLCGYYHLNDQNNVIIKIYQRRTLSYPSDVEDSQIIWKVKTVYIL